MKNLKYVALLGIVLFGFVLRIYKVSSIPPSLTWDEVSIGYNAYSILKTGHDEHGRYFPFDTFAAYGDYKPPIPIYLTVPFVAVFGLNELAVRLPSVLAGTFTILFVYFFVKELFGNEEVSMLTSLLLTISPWHIQLSRAGFEANIALFFVVLGSYLILKKKFLICWTGYVAAIYTFNSARYVVPFLSIIFFVYVRKDLLAYKGKIAKGLLIAFILILPIVPHLLSKEARIRFSEVNIFSDPGLVLTANDRMALDGGLWANIFHNRRIGYMRSYLLHFFDNLEPRFLFTRGDGNPKFSLQDVGEFYLVEVPFFILGFIWLFRNQRRIVWVLVGWIIASIIPAATARETPHALRIENTLPAFLIVISYAISQMTRKRIFTIGIVVLYAANFSFFWHNYMNHYATEFSGEWQYGYKQALVAIRPYRDQYKQIVITESIGRPYMYVLFYEKIDPSTIKDLLSSYFDADGFYHVTRVGKYAFVKEVIGFEKDTLYVLTPREVHPKAQILGEIQLLNGTKYLNIFDI